MAQLPEWASDENFPAGSKPWNGEPTRVEPANTIKARGFLPGTVPPAGWVNYLLGILIDESNDQDLRLAAAEALTIQGAFDNSVADGNNPTIKLKAFPATGANFVIQDATGRAVMSVQGESGGVTLTPAPASGLALGIKERGYVAWNSTDNSKVVFLRAPSGLSESYKLEFPTASPASKSVMSRAAGAASAGTMDWTALDWGDTDGGGSGWTATVSNISGDVSAVFFERGMWQRIGDMVSFSATGTITTTAKGSGRFDVAPPVGSVSGTYGAILTGNTSKGGLLEGTTSAGNIRIPVITGDTGAGEKFSLSGHCRVV